MTSYHLMQLRIIDDIFSSNYYVTKLLIVFGCARLQVVSYTLKSGFSFSYSSWSRIQMWEVWLKIILPILIVSALELDCNRIDVCIIYCAVCVYWY